MAVLHRITLEPAAAAEALREGAPETSRIWDALVAGDLDAVRIGRAAAAPASTVPSGPRCLLPGWARSTRCTRGTGGCSRRPPPASAPVRPAAARTSSPSSTRTSRPLSPEDAAATGSSGSRATRWCGSPAPPPSQRRHGSFPGATFAVGVDTIVAHRGAPLLRRPGGPRERRSLLLSRVPVPRVRAPRRHGVRNPRVDSPPRGAPGPLRRHLRSRLPGRRLVHRASPENGPASR